MMGVQAAQYPIYPMFDRRTRLLYALLAGSILFQLLLLLALGLRIGSVPNIFTLYWPPLIVGAWASRRIGFNRLATGFEALALLYAQALALAFLTLILATVSGPLADPWLAAADRWLGFDWLAYHYATRPYFESLRFAYNSIQWLPAVVIIGLAIEHRSERVWQFVTAALVALIVTIAIFPFAPAASPIIFYQISDPVLEGAARFWPIMSALREGGVQTIGVEHFSGMVSFPSYHTVVAIHIAWAAFGSRWLRWPVGALCGAMVLAIPTVGDHYLIDMIAGALLGIASIPVAKWLVRSSSGTVETAAIG